MVENCPGCRYRSNDPNIGWICAYMAATGKSRVAQMSREEMRSGSCRFREEGMAYQREIPRPMPEREPRPHREPRKRNGMRGPIYPDDAFLRAYDKGLSDGGIAKEVGCSKDYVYRWRKAKELPCNRENGRDPLLWGKARRLYMEGLSDLQIAVAIGRKRQSVAKWRLDNKLPPNAGGDGLPHQ